MDLPRFILLKSNINNKYLRYRNEEDSSHAFLQFVQEEEDEDVEFRCVKFEVQKAETEGFFHVRSCYNNKYWVRKSVDNNSIVAEANEPEEDQSKISCTLFKPFLVEEDNNSVATEADDDSDVPLGEPRKIRLMHIDQLGQHYACVSKTRGDHAFDLLIGDQNSDLDARSAVDSGDVFTVYNGRSYVILPAYLAFMGHNNQYCAVTTVRGINYLEFKTPDIGTWGTSNQIFQHRLQLTINMRNETTRDFWRISSPYIVVSRRDPLETFTAIQLDSNAIALRSQTNNRFAHSVRGQGLQNIIGIEARSIDTTARFRVAEPVLRREIRNVNYRLRDARIYNVSSVEMYRDSRINDSSVEQIGMFRVRYMTSQSMTWNNSVTVTTGITASWSSSIPFVGSFGVELSTERTESREWGTEKVEEREVEYQQTLTMPPRKRVTLTVLATKAFCDVPFSCDVRDTMTDGTVRQYTKRDGLYEGSNQFNFETHITDEDL